MFIVYRKHRFYIGYVFICLTLHVTYTSCVKLLQLPDTNLCIMIPLSIITNFPLIPRDMTRTIYYTNQYQFNRVHLLFTFYLSTQYLQLIRGRYVLQIANSIPRNKKLKEHTHFLKALFVFPTVNMQQIIIQQMSNFLILKRRRTKGLTSSSVYHRHVEFSSKLKSLWDLTIMGFFTRCLWL